MPVREANPLTLSHETRDDVRARYEDVMTHYRACGDASGDLSDTWAHTLEQKGRSYSLDEMLHMRAPGSKVTSWMVDSSYRIDHTVLDESDPTTARLLEAGEPVVGVPRRDIAVGSRRYSSLFLRDVRIAAGLIGRLEQGGMTRPTVIEIGGGVGLLQYLLRAYYGNRLTLIAVDIPETLLIQEWYLRNCFPEAPTAYKATRAWVAVVEGGLNFVNAHVLDSQDLGCDVAINIDSMQEMRGDTATRYIRYLERNLTSGGLFHFQNHHGHSAAAVPEPSEYAWDAYWTVEEMDLACQFDNCSEAEMARIVLRRTPDPERVDVRRLILRVLWNGLVTGAVAGRDLVEQLCRIPRTRDGADPMTLIEQTLRSHAVTLRGLRHLQDHPHLPADAYDPPPARPHRLPSDACRKTALMQAIRAAQLEVIALMSATGGDPSSRSLDSVRVLVKTICQDLLRRVGEPPRSEYWAAYLAGVLFPLGAGEEAGRLLRWAASWSGHPAWLMRFASLSARYEDGHTVRELLARARALRDDDLELSLKDAELAYLCGEREEARASAASLLPRCGSDLIMGPLLAKVAAQVQAPKTVIAVCTALREAHGAAATPALLDCLCGAAAWLAREEAVSVERTITRPLRLEALAPELLLPYGALQVMLGRERSGRRIIERAARAWPEHYYKLAWAGKMAQEVGLHDLADGYLSRSVRLRPANFLHEEFVGNVYLAAGRFRMARVHFEESVALKPYLRHLRARAAYCALPNEVREAGVFGRPADLEVLFQRTQAFYQVGPGWK